MCIRDSGGDSRSVDPDDMYELVDKYPQYISGVTPYVSAQLAVRQGSEDLDVYKRQLPPL